MSAHFSWPKSLLYHAVVPKTNQYTEPDYHVLFQENLEKQLSLAKRIYPILHPDEYADLLSKGRRLPKKSLLVTFDDGYQNILDYALPVAEALKIPILVFFNTLNLDGQKWLWFSRLKALQQRAQFDWVEYANRCQNWNLPQINQWLNQLEAPTVLGSSDEEKKQFNGAQIDHVKKAIEKGYLIPGGHTHSHVKLTKESSAIIQTEVENNKNDLEQLFGRKLLFFAYPEGLLNLEIAQTVKNCGYIGAFATDYPKKDFPSDLYPFHIPRIGIYRGNLLYFAAKLFEVKEQLKRIR